MKQRKIIFNILALVLLVGYVVVGSMLYNQRSSQNLCKALTIEVVDSSKAKFITTKTITHLLDSLQITPIGTPIQNLPLAQIEQLINQQPFVDKANVYSTIKGDCIITLNQKIPKIILSTTTGFNRYIDSNLNLIPLSQDFFLSIPIVTGNPLFTCNIDSLTQITKKNAPQDAIFFENLINFVEYIAKDDFLKDLITQVYVNRDFTVELVPRIGEQIIVVGSLEGFPKKMSKLKLFYQECFKNGWWKTAKKIDLQYINQIVVK